MHTPRDATRLLDRRVRGCNRPVFGSLRQWAVPFAGALGASMLIGLACAPAAGGADSIAGSAQQLPVRGVVRPSAQATLSTDLAASVAKVGFKEGEEFRRGDVLVAFDCRRQQAELASAVAQQREMVVAFESASFLEKRNASSHQDVETTRARADKAAAEVEAMRVRLDQCSIVAPYDGRITELRVHEHEMSVAGRPLLSIAAKWEPEIELIVPSTWLTWLTPGAEFQFLVDETGKSYPGMVVRLGAAVDTVSQTIKAFAKFTAATPDILIGMTGTVQFRRQEG